MFVEKLYELNPENFKKAIMKILEMGDHNELELIEVQEGCVKFGIVNPFDPEVHSLYVSDFEILGAYHGRMYDEEYRKFMAQVLGSKYIIAFQEFRNEEKRVIVNKFDKETNDLVKSMTKAITSKKKVYEIDAKEIVE